MIQAELLVGRGQKEQALAVLLKLRQENPKNALLLKRLTDLYLSLQDWKALHDLIPTIRKFARIPDDKLQELEERNCCKCWSAPVFATGQWLDPGRAAKTYNDSARPLRYSLPIAKRYIELLVELKAEALAEQELRSILNNLWHDDLVCLYGQVQGEDAGRQLLFAENNCPNVPTTPYCCWPWVAWRCALAIATKHWNTGQPLLRFATCLPACGNGQSAVRARPN